MIVAGKLPTLLLRQWGHTPSSLPCPPSGSGATPPPPCLALPPPQAEVSPRTRIHPQPHGLKCFFGSIGRRLKEFWAQCEKFLTVGESAWHWPLRKTEYFGRRRVFLFCCAIPVDSRPWIHLRARSTHAMCTKTATRGAAAAWTKRVSVSAQSCKFLGHARHQDSRAILNVSRAPHAGTARDI